MDDKFGGGIGNVVVIVVVDIFVDVGEDLDGFGLGTNDANASFVHLLLIL